MSWCTIESDPGVFTELISAIGVKGIQVAELWGLEAEAFEKLKPVYGLIFLFKWQQDVQNTGEPIKDYDARGVFFARQVINNACATQAIISVLLNRNDIELGSELTNFKDFATALTPEDRGQVLGQSDVIRIAHNSFARPEPFELDERPATSDDDEVCHFVGYVPVNGGLYELDGLKSGPVFLGDCTLDNWLDVARPAIQQRINKYSEKEIRFNLLALTQNRQEVYAKRTEEIKVRREKINHKLSRIAGNATAMDTDDDLPASKDELQFALLALEEEQKEINQGIQEEKERFAHWKEENIRRKHNYVPFVFNLFTELARMGKLQGLVEEAKKAQEKQHKAALERKAKEKESKQTGTPAVLGPTGSSSDKQ